MLNPEGKGTRTALFEDLECQLKSVVQIFQPDSQNLIPLLLHRSTLSAQASLD